jgi:hypothetical protein
MRISTYANNSPSLPNHEPGFELVLRLGTLSVVNEKNSLSPNSNYFCGA